MATPPMPTEIAPTKFKPMLAQKKLLRSSATLTLAALFFTAMPVPAAPLPSSQAKPSAPKPTRETRVFLERASKKLGPEGRRAAEFLCRSMPERDRQTLTADFLMENLRLALAARKRFPWAKNLTDERFFNDVTPYAVLDETREAWRPKMLLQAQELVKGSHSASEAAQALNRQLFNLVGVHYNTNREKPNQSPSESIAQGRATCTGLAILLVDACRAVGIPARVAGVAKWTTKEGNHTWVEIWDGEWKFLGADEYDAQGLNRGWFVGDAAQAVADVPRNAVWASSWQPSDGAFPLVWDENNRSVAATNVTNRYVPKTSATEGKTLVHLRVLDSALNATDARIVVTAQLLDADGKVLGAHNTKAGRADWNDTASFRVAPGNYLWRLQRGAQTRQAPLVVETDAEKIIELDWQKLSEVSPAAPLTKIEAKQVLNQAWQALQGEQDKTRSQELETRTLVVGDKMLRWKEKTYGDKPADGYALWISMHGGGGTTPEVNDQQYANQINLYGPMDGIWVAPRAPNDAWDMWHQTHIDAMFDRIIADYVLLRGVNPNRVYLLGYSAGGDGVYQLAPRMADRFAAASMMAGHPNNASPLGLRDLPFAIFVGGEDAAYNRNQVAREWGEKLDDLQKNDAGGYTHQTKIYPGLGHWMNRLDAEALPWMAKFTRDPWPKTVVWHQDDVTHDRFYWLALPAGTAAQGQTISATVSGQTIRVSAQGVNQLNLRLSDALLNLDLPVKVVVNGQTVFDGAVQRHSETIVASLQERADIASAATAQISLRW